AQHFTLVDEQRYAHHGAGFELGRLLAASGRIAAHAGVGLDHLQFDMRRRGDLQRHAVPQRHDAVGAFLEPLDVVAHRFLAGGVLLEILRHHEMPEVAIGIQVLHVGVDHIGGLYRVAALEGALDGAPGLQVADADTVERLPLARFDHLVLDDRVGIVVEQDLQSGLEFIGAVAGHGALWLYALRMYRGRRWLAAYVDDRQTPAGHDLQRRPTDTESAPWVHTVTYC